MRDSAIELRPLPADAPVFSCLSSLGCWEGQVCGQGLPALWARPVRTPYGAQRTHILLLQSNILPSKCSIPQDCKYIPV